MADVEYEVRDQIAYITLNRPEKHNAISLHVEELLHEAWQAFASDDDARVAILSGNGKNFCAGADLSDHVDQWTGAGPELGYEVQDKGFGGRITRGLHKTPKPIIAANHGWTVGGGIEISLACDMRVCTEDTQYGFFHIRRGMHFADGGLVRLINICGYGIAMELELLGEPVDAQRAKECHLVNRVVAAGEHVAEAEEMASKIIRNPRVGVESAKRTALEVIGRPLDDQLRLEAFYGYSIMGDPEIVERKDQFLAREDQDRPQG
jgi:enoyl-CoA hydratase